MSGRTQKLKKLNELELELRRREVPGMPGRSDLEPELLQIDKELRELVIAYEQYFIGTDKFEPAKERQILTLRLRRLVNVYIPQTDLRFRLQALASRLQSYAGYWDRILRLIEEGRYIRQRSHLQGVAQPPHEEPRCEASFPAAALPLERIYHELVEAYARCGMTPPAREQVATFLTRQAGAIRERFGDRPVELVVVVEDGKPKIRARARG
jgi:hypothetical protein